MKITFIDGSSQDFSNDLYHGLFHNNHPVFKVESKDDPNELVHLFPLSYIKEITL